MPNTRTAATRALLAPLLAALLVLSSCGNSDDDDAAAEDPTTETTEAGGEEPSDEPAGDEGPWGEFVPIEGVPGVTDEAINLAVLSTGAANPLGYCLLECYADGIEAYAAWRNSQGGVHGRDLVVAEIVDDELANNQVKALELAANDDIFAVFSVPIIASGFQDLADAGVPVYTNAVASAVADGNETIFPHMGVSCIDCPGKFNVFLPTLADASKVGSLGYGVSEASKACVDGHGEAFDRWGADAGVEQVYSNNELPFGLPNGLGPEVTAMKNAGVDFILTCLDQNGALTLEQELQRQGMGDVPVVLPQGYSDSEFVETNADLLEGDYLNVPQRPFEADPGETSIPEFFEWIEETGGQVTDHAMQAWINGETLFQGLLAAGPEFDRESVVAATNEMTEFTADGLIPPVDWTRQHAAPTPDDAVSNGPVEYCSTFVRIADGGFELVGDPAEPWYCFEAAEEGWVEPTVRNFD